jgi:hypothetical protein
MKLVLMQLKLTAPYYYDGKLWQEQEAILEQSV